jgi:hypothetical protein
VVLQAESALLPKGARSAREFKELDRLRSKIDA